MSKYTPGALGEFTGTTGDLVTCRWRKLKIGRNRPAKTKNKPTEAIQVQRLKIGLMSHFLKQLKKTVTAGYLSKNGDKTARENAMKYNLKHAISGTFSEPRIDYAKVQLSSGTLDQIYTPSITITEGNMIQVNWLNSPNLKIGSQENDVVFLSFYGENESVITKENAGLRSEGVAVAKLSRTILASTVHTWMFLISADGKRASSSRYLGSISLNSDRLVTENKK